jgi:hypothetical protein
MKRRHEVEDVCKLQLLDPTNVHAVFSSEEGRAKAAMDLDISVQSEQILSAVNFDPSTILSGFSTKSSPIDTGR